MSDDREEDLVKLRATRRTRGRGIVQRSVGKGGEVSLLIELDMMWY